MFNCKFMDNLKFKISTINFAFTTIRKVLRMLPNFHILASNGFAQFSNI